MYAKRFEFIFLIARKGLKPSPSSLSPLTMGLMYCSKTRTLVWSSQKNIRCLTPNLLVLVHWGPRRKETAQKPYKVCSLRVCSERSLPRAGIRPEQLLRQLNMGRWSEAEHSASVWAHLNKTFKINFIYSLLFNSLCSNVNFLPEPDVVPWRHPDGHWLIYPAIFPPHRASASSGGKLPLEQPGDVFLELDCTSGPCPLSYPHKESSLAVVMLVSTETQMSLRI